MKMKVQISKSFKGELYIKSKNKTFKTGTKIYLSDEEFYDSFTQSLISKGWLVALEEYEKGESKLIRLRSKKKNPMIFQVIKRAVNPNEIFYIPTDQFSNGQIQQALELGHIVEEPVPSDNKGDDDESSSSVSSRPNKPSPSPASIKQEPATKKKSRSIKRVASEDDAPVKSASLQRKARVGGNKPEDSFVYRPDNVEINEPPHAIDLDGDMDDIFVDSDQQSEDVAFIDEKQAQAEKVSFVDKEQQKARVQRSKRTRAKNNEEIQ
jgi:hypothetical protein